MTDPFNPAPVGDVPDFLKPNPPAPFPEAPGAGNAVEALSPFNEPQDVDAIIKQLVLDRPLKLYIPDREKYPQFEFRIINSIPQEIADAHNKGFKEVTDPKLTGLFTDLVAGTDKNGKAFRPMLMARPVAVGEVVRKRKRQELAQIYAGMDPNNVQIDGKYTDRVQDRNLTKGKFDGAGWRIRV